MSFTLRPLDPEQDFAPLAVPLSHVESEPVTEAVLRNRETRRPADDLQRRMVAVDGDGRLVGFGRAARQAWKMDRFPLAVVVDPAARGVGLGGTLYEELIRFAAGAGAASGN